MYLKGDNQKENKSRAVANSAVQEKHDKQALQFVDNRKSTATQRKLQVLATKTEYGNNSTASKDSGVKALQMKGYAGTRPLGQRESEEEQERDDNKGLGNHRLVHAHIKLDNAYNLPQVGKQNNVGFHDNSLFNENVGKLGYTWRHEFNDEAKLVTAIKANDNPGKYNLLGNNCQHWVERVKNTYNSTKEIEMQNMKNGKYKGDD